MYLALAVSSAGFPPAIHVLGYSRITIKEINYFRLRDYHPLRCRFPAASTNNLFFDSSSNLHCYLTTPSYCYEGLGFFLFARRYWGNKYFFLFLLVLRCFTSQGLHSDFYVGVIEGYSIGFPHSEISGSKVAWHLPEAYRSNATSFLATFSQGIHRTPLNFLLRNLKTTFLVSFPDRSVLGNCSI